jgi:hypothetical protein
MIRVERLVLDIPGMTPGRAGTLSRAIGRMLGDQSASAARLDVLLPPGGAPSDEAILAAVAAALLARLG